MRVTVAWGAGDWVTHVTVTWSPGLNACSAWPRAEAESMAVELIAVIAEFGVMPALAAGEPAWTVRTSAPDVTLSPSWAAVAASSGIGSTPTPRWPTGP